MFLDPCPTYFDPNLPLYIQTRSLLSTMSFETTVDVKGAIHYHLTCDMNNITASDSKQRLDFEVQVESGLGARPADFHAELRSMAYDYDQLRGRGLRSMEVVAVDATDAAVEEWRSQLRVLSQHLRVQQQRPSLASSNRSVKFTVPGDVHLKVRRVWRQRTSGLQHSESACMMVHR